MATLKEIFDRQFEGIKFDKAFCIRLIQFSNYFMTKNTEHAEFFGSPLLGVNLIRFTDSESRHYFDDTLGIDEIALRDDFKANASSVNFDFNVMSEPFNYLGCYIAYRLTKERSIPSAIRDQARIHAIMITNYRFLSGLFYRRFSYKADYEVAMATYSNLSMRFEIRRYGTWRKLLEERAKDVLFKTPTFKAAVNDFEPDKNLINTVIGMQGGIRSIVNNYYTEYMNTLERRERISTQSGVLSNVSGEAFLRDSTHGVPVYQLYMSQVLSSGTSFIKKDLVAICAKLCTHANEEALTRVLDFIVNNANVKKYGYITELINDIIIYTFEFSRENSSTIRNNDFVSLLEKLKGKLTSSRVTDPTVLSIRKTTDKLLRVAYPVKTAHFVTAIRTAVILYIALRVVTKDYYT